MSNVDVKSIDQLLHPNFDEKALKQATEISKIGLPASPERYRTNCIFS